MQIYFLDEGHERKNEVLSELSSQGASYENANSKMYAIDCEPGVDIVPMIDYLDEMKKNGLLDFRISEY